MPAELPKYLQIYGDIRSGVFSGEYAAGAELPSESMLCRQYNVSRETARKALRDLENEGLVYSVPKVGYFVGSPNHTDLKLTSGRNWSRAAPSASGSTACRRTPRWRTPWASRRDSS